MAITDTRHMAQEVEEAIGIVRKQAGISAVNKLADLANIGDNGLAEFGLDDSVLGDSGAGAEMRAAVAELVAEQRKTTMKEAAHLVVALIKNGNDVVAATISELRDIRRREDAIKKKLSDIAVAKAYGEKTMNWLPLQDLITGVSLTANPRISQADIEVPEDFAKEFKAVQKAKATKPTPEHQPV